MATWLFELAGVPGAPTSFGGSSPTSPIIDEITDTFDRNVVLQLNRFDTCSFRIKLDNPLADLIAACDGYVKAYRNGVLTFYGPIVSTEESGSISGANIAVNCVSPGWNLAKRFIRAETQFTTTAIDRAALAAEMVNWVNLAGVGANASSGTVDIVPASMSAGGTITNYPPVNHRFVWDLILELAAGAAGFDWRIMPVEGVQVSTNVYATGNMIAAPVLGSSKPDAIFEWGTDTRANAVSYRRTYDREEQTNYVHVFNTENPTVLAATVDFDSYYKWNAMDAHVETEITQSSLLYDLAEEHRNVRADPRMMIEVQPHLQDGTGRVPEFAVDYNIGDTIRARAVYGSLVRFDRLVRVWSAAFSVDDNNVERINLTLADQ